MFAAARKVDTALLKPLAELHQINRLAR